MTARSPLRRAWHYIKRALRLLGIGVVLVAVFAIIDGWQAFGHGAQGERLARMQQSPQYGDDTFVNPQPLVNHFGEMITGMLAASDDGTPHSPLPVEMVDASRFATPPASGLRVTWLGHSTMLLELDGHRILTDPVWGERSSPLSWIGPERWYAPPLALADVPQLDAVILSHDHYDHLDHPTIVAMKDWDTVFIAPLGVGAHLAYWGVPEANIIELDWWQHHAIGDLEIVSTPARHASGRTLLDNDETLWAGYALIGRQHRVFFSGDTGLFPALHDIGQQLGPFDLTMIEAGAYGSAWPDWHLGPEQAVTAHRMVRGKVMLPVHWGLFNLAYHGWTEPIERVLAAARDVGVEVIAPRPGQSIEPSAPPPIDPWWPTLAWQTAAQNPIVATKMEGAVLP